MEYKALIIATTNLSADQVVDGDAPISYGTNPAVPYGLPGHHMSGADHTGNTGGRRVGRAKAVAQPQVGRTAGGQQRRVRQFHNLNAEGTAHVTTRTGVPICPAFNPAGGCQPTIGANWCPVLANALHLCERCLQPTHGVGSGRCPQTEISAMPAGMKGKGKQGKGKGKGRGKGKGGKRAAPY